MRKTLERRLEPVRLIYNSGQTAKLPPPPSLNTASTYFRLDPRVPGQRDLLLFALAEVVFGKGRVGRPNRPSEWGRWRLAHLGSLYEKYRRDGARGDRKIAELIKANHTRTFGRTTAEAIRKVLPAARFRWQEALDLHGYDDVDFDAPGDPLPDGWDDYVDLN
jgi:hypothetical protein